MLNGIINVYKEKGYTSHDVVAKLRGILKQKKIGHTGTLDPEAEGVLPVCLGKATKLCDLLTEKDKTYQTVLLLGLETDTQDTTGKVLEQYTGDFKNLNEQQIVTEIQSFIGSYDQTPPMYSALKVNGRKLYELARAGIEIERKSRAVLIHNITINKIDLPRIELTVECSKGTYIRTLCHDIGKKLGCGGCMEYLLRTKVSIFDISNSMTLKEISDTKENIEDYIMKIDDMFGSYPEEKIPSIYDKFLYNGNKLPEAAISGKYEDTQRLRVYNEKDVFIGIYEYNRDEHSIKLIKMFYDTGIGRGENAVN